MIGGDTPNPDKLAETLKRMLLTAKQGDNFTTRVWSGRKRKKLVDFLRAINSPEYIANQFTRYAFNEMNLFDVVPTLESITMDEIKTAAAEFISEDRFTVCQVVPE